MPSGIRTKEGKGTPGPYRFFFFSFDCNEPKPVHIQREKLVCKFWLDHLDLSKNYGFPPKELGEIRRLEAWHGHCGWGNRTKACQCPGFRR
ncbi:DUF4160 domain-containing protein [Desulfobacca acetoxidans]|uniref:DUF4160 domain-containing protein n=1 Tax=Desulfobacca acetoxidans TaxID=60893 RepID=UPI001C54C233